MRLVKYRRHWQIEPIARQARSVNGTKTGLPNYGGDLQAVAPKPVSSSLSTASAAHLQPQPTFPRGVPNGDAPSAEIKADERWEATLTSPGSVGLLEEWAEEASGIWLKGGGKIWSRRRCDIGLGPSPPKKSFD